MTQPTPHFDATPIFAALTSSALASGIFDSVAGHEPKNKPGNGITSAFMAGDYGPARGSSGLSSTTMLWIVKQRIYIPALRGPLDQVEIDIVNTGAAMIAIYSGGFTVGSLVRDVDLLAQFGTPLSARPGYLEQGGTVFRINDVTIPLVINDVFDQAA